MSTVLTTTLRQVPLLFSSPDVETPPPRGQTASVKLHSEERRTAVPGFQAGPLCGALCCHAVVCAEVWKWVSGRQRQGCEPPWLEPDVWIHTTAPVRPSVWNVVNLQVQDSRRVAMDRQLPTQIMNIPITFTRYFGPLCNLSFLGLCRFHPQAASDGPSQHYRLLCIFQNFI